MRADILTVNITETREPEPGELTREAIPPRPLTWHGWRTWRTWRDEVEPLIHIEVTRIWSAWQNADGKIPAVPTAAVIAEGKINAMLARAGLADEVLATVEIKHEPHGWAPCPRLAVALVWMHEREAAHASVGPVHEHRTRTITETDWVRLCTLAGLVSSVEPSDLVRAFEAKRVEVLEAKQVLASYCPEADPSRLSLRGVVALLESDVLADRE